MNLDDVVARIDGLSLASDITDNGVHHGYRRCVIVNGGTYRLAEFAGLLAEFEPVRECWLSWIEPGGHIVEHIDGGPYYERWQVPLTANGVLRQGDTDVDHVVGEPFRVSQWEWHSVTNDSAHARVSLVIDRNIPAGVPTAPFQTKG